MSRPKVLPNEQWIHHQYLHTAARLQERYGIVIGKQLYDTLCSVAKVSNARVPYRRNSRFEVRIVKWMNREMPVAWDIFHEVVASVLPRSSLKYFRDRAPAPSPNAAGKGLWVSQLFGTDSIPLTKAEDLPTVGCKVCGEEYRPSKKTKDEGLCSACKGAVGVLKARPSLMYRLCTHVSRIQPCEWCAPSTANAAYPFFGYE